MKDCLIVGQGIAGTCLAHSFLERGARVDVASASEMYPTSQLAAAVINPVTGRKWVKTWNADVLLTLARDFYPRCAARLGVQSEYLHERKILLAGEKPEVEEAFLLRTGDPLYSDLLGDTPGRIPAQLEGVRFYGSIHGAMQLDMGEFIVDSRAYFKGKEMYIEDRVTPDEAVFENGSWTCRGESYKWLVFCEGHYGFDNLWFDFLPFHTAKGELLICEIPGLVSADIIKGGVTIVPLPDPHIFWVGSTYEWDTDDDSPSAGAREELESKLEELVGKEYTVLTHRAGIRPAARDRRPFVGTHPANRQLGLINGLGTKGASLAPYCAEQLVSHLLDGNTLDPEIDLLRYHDS